MQEDQQGNEGLPAVSKGYSDTDNTRMGENDMSKVWYTTINCAKEHWKRHDGDAGNGTSGSLIQQLSTTEGNDKVCFFEKHNLIVEYLAKWWGSHKLNDHEAWRKSYGTMRQKCCWIDMERNACYPEELYHRKKKKKRKIKGTNPFKKDKEKEIELEGPGMGDTIGGEGRRKHKIWFSRNRRPSKNLFLKKVTFSQETIPMNAAVHLMCLGEFQVGQTKSKHPRSTEKTKKILMSKMDSLFEELETKKKKLKEIAANINTTDENKVLVNSILGMKSFKVLKFSTKMAQDGKVTIDENMIELDQDPDLNTASPKAIPQATYASRLSGQTSMACDDKSQYYPPMCRDFEKWRTASLVGYCSDMGIETCTQYSTWVMGDGLGWYKMHTPKCENLEGSKKLLWNDGHYIRLKTLHADTTERGLLSGNSVAWRDSSKIADNVTKRNDWNKASNQAEHRDMEVKHEVDVIPIATIIKLPLIMTNESTRRKGKLRGKRNRKHIYDVILERVGDDALYSFDLSGHWWIDWGFVLLVVAIDTPVNQEAGQDPLSDSVGMAMPVHGQVSGTQLLNPSGSNFCPMNTNVSAPTSPFKPVSLVMPTDGFRMGGVKVPDGIQIQSTPVGIDSSQVVNNHPSPRNVPPATVSLDPSGSMNPSSSELDLVEKPPDPFVSPVNEQNSGRRSSSRLALNSLS
ncbi:hypothetical protein L1987_28334 [Smallanthus sonchifolius]|uniref:Uncharacterized protein n=1 Tax=Smallanthus sonchifolius TaxID=185202 RepID=A0ACB9HXR2_9ASTR|nr:hypothetical protein L1987_28334 [Smallanthus sonchifolius]